MDIKVNLPADSGSILENMTDAHIVAVMDSMRRGEVTNIIATRGGPLHISFGVPHSTIKQIYDFIAAHPEKNYQATVADFVRAGYDVGVFHAPRGLMESLSATGAGMFFGALAGGAILQQLNVAGTSVGAAGQTVSAFGQASAVSPEFAAYALGEAPISATIGGFLPAAAPVTTGFLTQGAIESAVAKLGGTAATALGTAATGIVTASLAPKPKIAPLPVANTAPAQQSALPVVLGIAAVAALVLLS